LELVKPWLNFLILVSSSSLWCVDNFLWSYLSDWSWNGGVDQAHAKTAMEDFLPSQIGMDEFIWRRWSFSLYYGLTPAPLSLVYSFSGPLTLINSYNMLNSHLFHIKPLILVIHFRYHQINFSFYFLSVILFIFNGNLGQKTIRDVKWP